MRCLTFDSRCCINLKHDRIYSWRLAALRRRLPRDPESPLQVGTPAFRACRAFSMARVNRMQKDLASKKGMRIHVSQVLCD
jgi:hypothetical protein